MNKDSLLIVEDDPSMQQLLQSQLGARGYAVTVVGDGAEAVHIVGINDFSLVLLDITLPGMDGLDVCRQIRSWSSVPIILVTAADMPHMKIAGLELGADDYLTKPFHIGELVARIRAVSRRIAGQTTQPSVLEFGGISVDLARRQVRYNDTPVRLTKLEFDLLQELVTHIDQVLTYAHLLNAIWGQGYDDIRPVHVHICNLRRKLEQGPTGPRHILAVPGIGYRFRPGEE